MNPTEKRWSIRDGKHRVVAPVIALIQVLAMSGSEGRAASRDGLWNQFRGADGSGVAPAARPPVKIGADCLAWKVSIPPGHSSPVLSRDRLFLTAIDRERLVTLAFDAKSGQLAWRQEAPKVPIEKVHDVSSPAASTPYVDDTRIYVYFGSYGMLCYDHAGNEQWRKPIPTPKSPYGMAMSPIGSGDNLILVLDNDANLPDSKLSQSRIIALRRENGEQVWETARPFLRSGWSTPVIWSHDDGQELVVLGGGRVCGYDPKTGAEKWFATGFSRETIAQPVPGNGRVYASAAMLGGVSDEQPDPQPFWQAMLQFDTNSDGRLTSNEITRRFAFPLRPELPVEHPGFGIPLPDEPVKRRARQAEIFRSMDKDKDGAVTRDEFLANMSFNRGKPTLMAIRPGGQGDITASHVEWRLHQGIPEIPSPIFHRDRLYLARNGGILTAVDAGSGKVVYSERLNSAGQYCASPVIANDHLYLISNRGVVSVVQVGDTFKLVHQHDLKEAAFATPAFDAATLYLRTETNLWAFRTP